ncbi:MAG: M20/M25/M40 family metallo-hydrolase [Gemmatimonadota bacterium]|nr:MAG: M20/M25/M40 family metallo-hydrolase [Gemmatimonadota bacterium]
MYWIDRRLRVEALAILTTVLAGILAPQARAQSAQERILAGVRYLAADAREGRGVGTAGLDSAAAYVVRQFAAAGLMPAGSEGFLQPFTIDPSAPAVAHSGLGGAAVKNVVGLIPGRGDLSAQAVVLGAHYDHLGLGGPSSLDSDSLGVVHNGADDNASGTVALMETARMLNRRSSANMRTIVFVAFTAEELGLIGSDHYVKNPSIANDSTYAMLNFDMVGRLRDNKLITGGTGSAPELPQLLDSVNTGYGLTLSAMDDPWGRSDHSSFYAAGIPVIHFLTDTHEDYHRTTDDWDKINVAGIERVAMYATDLAWSLATRRTPLTYVDVPQPVMATSGGGGAWLGTIPDMSGSPGGVRLTGVREGGPAQTAGIKGGDIIVQIGDFEVKDLYAMTEALRSFKPGDVTTVAVMRDGERVEMRVTFGKRGG